MSTVDSKSEVLVAPSPQRQRCQDNLDFRNSFGTACEEHTNVRCEALKVLGWTQDEVNSLLHNCPSSCAVSGCNDESPPTTNWFQRPTAAPTLNIMTSAEIDLLHEDTTSNVHVAVDTSRTLLRSRQSVTTQACYPRWPATCQDDPTYMSRMNVGCSAFEVFNDCFDAKAVVAFSDDEIFELIGRCPCTCKTQCTEAPTPAPYTLPPVGPMFNEFAAAVAAGKKGSEGDSTDTLMTTIMSVGGAVAFFVFALATAFVVTQVRSKNNHRIDEDDRSDTSELSDEFDDRDDDQDDDDISASRSEQRRGKKKRKKKKAEEAAQKASFMCPDIDLCI